jgi:hypothetical protein
MHLPIVVVTHAPIQDKHDTLNGLRVFARVEHQLAGRRLAYQNQARQSHHYRLNDWLRAMMAQSHFQKWRHYHLFIVSFRQTRDGGARIIGLSVAYGDIFVKL